MNSKVLEPKSVVLEELTKVKVDSTINELQNRDLQSLDTQEPSSTKEALVDPILDLKKDAKDFKEFQFRAYLNAYATKNNVFWVLTDVTSKNILYKKSGGMECKRGTQKNSQKVSTKNLEDLIKVIEDLKIDFLILKLRSGVFQRKHNMTTKSIEKLFTTLKIKNCYIHDIIINSTRENVSKIRIKGGRRGRRV